MRRAVFSLVLAGSLLALACGHEASAPSAPAARDVDIAFAAPAVTTLQALVPASPAPAPTAPAAAAAPTAPPCVEVDSELGAKHISLEGRTFVDDTNVSELHLAAGDGIALKPLLGAHVRVSGDPFGAHTAWHARPILLMVTSARNIANTSAH